MPVVFLADKEELVLGVVNQLVEAIEYSWAN